MGVFVGRLGKRLSDSHVLTGASWLVDWCSWTVLWWLWSTSSELLAAALKLAALFVGLAVILTEIAGFHLQELLVVTTSEWKWRESVLDELGSVAVVSLLIDSVVGEAFKFLTTGTVVPDLGDRLGLAVPDTVLTDSLLAALASSWLVKGWRRTVVAWGVIKIWALGPVTDTVVFGTALTNGSWVGLLELAALWDGDLWNTLGWIAIKWYDSPELAAFLGIEAVGDELMGLVVVAWLWRTVVSFVSARSNTGGGVATATDAFVITSPLVALNLADGGRAVFVVAETAVDVAASDLAAAFDLDGLWWAAVIAWGSKIWWEAESAVADARLALALIVFWVVEGPEGMVLWAWSLVVWAVLSTAAVWTLPAIATAVVSEVLWIVGDTVADTGWLGLATVSPVGTGDIVARVTGTGLALVDHPDVAKSVLLTVMVARALGAWDGELGESVLPTVVSSTSGPVVAGLSGWEWLAAWLLAWAVSLWNTGLEVAENLAFWALEGLLVVAKIDTSSHVVLAFAVLHGGAVAELVTSESADLVLLARWSWGWGTWNWGSAWGSSLDLLKTDTFDLSVQAVAGFSSSRLAWDLLAFGVLNSFDFHTEAFFKLHASHTIFGKNGTVWALAAFNTGILTLGFDNFPVAEVTAGLWTGADAGTVVSATVALHWAHTLVSPVDVDTLLVTSFGVSGNSGTEAFALTTGVASTCIKLTVVKVVDWVDDTVTLGKWASLVLDDRASLGRPSLSEWVLGADVKDSLWSSAHLVCSPRVSELENVFGSNAVLGDEVLLHVTVEVTADTLGLRVPSSVKLDLQAGTLVPDESNTELLGLDVDVSASELNPEGLLSLGGDWGASDEVDLGLFLTLANNEGDGLGADGTLGTASLVSSDNLELTVDLGVSVFAFSLELDLLSIKSLDMGVTISFAGTLTLVGLAVPFTDDAALTLVAIVHVGLASSVRSSAVVTWTLFSDDTGTGLLFENVSVEALAAAHAMVVKVWVDSLISVHVEASSLDWLEAIDKLHVESALLVLVTAGLISALPVTLVALADVAVLSSAFTGEVFVSVEEATALGLWNALAVVAENGLVWALAAWDAGLGAVDLVAVLKRTASSEAGLAALLPDLAGWALWHALGSLSPVLDHDTLLGAVHGVESSSLASDTVLWLVAVVLLALGLVWEVIDEVVALFKSGGVEDGTVLLGVWVSLLEHNAWFHSVLGWSDTALGISLPFLDESDNRFFDISLWGSEVIVVLAVVVTAETSELALGGSVHSHVDHIVLVPHDSTALSDDGDDVVVESLDEELVEVNRKSGDRLVLDVHGTSGEKFDLDTIGGEDKRSAALVTGGAVLVDHNKRVLVVVGGEESVTAFASEGVLLAVEGSHVALGHGADRVALVFGTVELAAEADALVAVSSKSLSRLEHFLTVKTWALLDGNTATVVSVLVEWAVTAFDTVFNVTLNLWVEAGWGAGGAANVVFLAFWAFHWTSSFGSPVDLDTVSAALVEVSGHGVAWSGGTEVVVAVEADVLLTGLKEWGWVDNTGAHGVHEVAAEHNSLGRLSHAFWGVDGAEGFFGGVWALIRVLPRVSEESNALDDISGSGHEVVGLVVVEHTAETAGLADKVLVNLDVDALVTVPLESPRVGGFLHDDVASDFGDVEGVEAVWKIELLTVLGGNNWTGLALAEGDPSVSNVDVDLSVASGIWAALSVVFDFDGEGTREDVLDEGVVAGTSESEHLTVKGSVVVLTPGHTVAGLVWVDLASVHNAKDLADLVLVDRVFLLHALWEVSGWVPSAIEAGVLTGDWDGRGELEAFVTGWFALELAVLVLAADDTVDWSVEVLALLGGTDTGWKSLSTSWEAWAVDTVVEVTEEEVGGLASVAIVASKSTDLDTGLDSALDGTVDWVESVTVVSIAWHKFANVASLHLNNNNRVLLWHESTATVESVLVARWVLGDVDLASLNLDISDLVVLELGNDLEGTVGVNSLDESGHLLLVHESNKHGLAVATALPVWGYWTDSSPGISGFADAVDNVSVGVSGVVLGVSVVVTTDTGGGEAESSSEEKGVVVEDHSNAVDEVNDNNSVALSVDLEGISELDWLNALIGTVGLSLEHESGAVASAGEHKSTGLLLALVDQVVAGSSVAVKTELVDVETAGALEESHLAAASLVAKEPTVEGLVPLTSGPDGASVVPVMMLWEHRALGKRAGVADALWGLVSGTGGGSFDLHAVSVDAPAVEVLVALEWLPGTAGGTGTAGKSAWGSSGAAEHLVGVRESFVGGLAVSLDDLLYAPVALVALDGEGVGFLLFEHETGLTGDGASTVVGATVEVGIFRGGKVAALGLTDG